MMLIGLLVYPIVWMFVASAVFWIRGSVAGGLVSTGNWLADAVFFALYTWLPLTPVIAFFGALHLSALYLFKQESEKSTLYFSVKVGLIIGLVLLVGSLWWFQKTIPNWLNRLMTYGLASFITAIVSGCWLGLWLSRKNFG